MIIAQKRDKQGSISPIQLSALSQALKRIQQEAKRRKGIICFFDFWPGLFLASHTYLRVDMGLSQSHLSNSKIRLNFSKILYSVRNQAQICFKNYDAHIKQLFGP